MPLSFHDGRKVCSRIPDALIWLLTMRDIWPHPAGQKPNPGQGSTPDYLGRQRGNRNPELVPEGDGVSMSVAGKSRKCIKPLWNSYSGLFVIEENPARIMLETKAARILAGRLNEVGQPTGQTHEMKVPGCYEF